MKDKKMTKEECYDFLRIITNQDASLVHAKNILKKKSDAKKLEILDKIVVKYVDYYQENKKLIGYSKEIIKERVRFRRRRCCKTKNLCVFEIIKNCFPFAVNRPMALVYNNKLEIIRRQF